MSNLAAEVALDFKQLEPANQVLFGNLVIAGFTANPVLFPTPTVTVVAFTAINGTYNGLITDAAGGDTLKIKQRNDYYELTWLPAMISNADYVESIAQGNATVIIQSGYHATKTSTTAHEIPVQMVLTAKGGAAGSASVEFVSKTVVDSHSFLVIGSKADAITIDQLPDHLVIHTSGATDIVIVPATSKRGHISGLVRKDEMDFVIAATNGAGTGPLSNKANVIVP